VKPFWDRSFTLARLPSKRPEKRGALGLGLLIGSLLLLWLAWPYVTLWRVERAAHEGDMEVLADLIDMSSVRTEIKHKLNKDADSDVGELSDPFIQWLQEGIAAMGSQAVDRLVTLSWVRARLIEHIAGSNEGLLGGGSYAFFDAPDGFIARIGLAEDTPLLLHLRFRGLRWRVSAVYY
jgi:hypothetical protein